MDIKNSDRIRTLLKGIETGDPAAVAVINPDKYIQHNPQTLEGRDGLAALFKRLSKTNPRVNIVRAFDTGDYVFAHTEYDFATRRIGFEVFRFEGEFTVEHWDNIQPRQGPSPSGHSMVDGPTEAIDIENTEANKALVGSFVETVLIRKCLDEMAGYFEGEKLIQHSPGIADGLPALRTALEARSDGGPAVDYRRLHRILGQGNFVLAVSEGSLRGTHTAFYDLFRVSGGTLAEHWDTIETVPPASEWKNDNGKF